MTQLDAMSTTEKKATAYDILAQIERLQLQLRAINQSIVEEANKEKKGE